MLAHTSWPALVLMNQADVKVQRKERILFLKHWDKMLWFFWMIYSLVSVLQGISTFIVLIQNWDKNKMRNIQILRKMEWLFSSQL